jgi:TctA family transporter
MRNSLVFLVLTLAFLLSLNLLPHPFTQIVLDSFAILVVMFAVFDCLLALAVGGIPSLSPSLCLYFLLPLIY